MLSWGRWRDVSTADKVMGGPSNEESISFFPVAAVSIDFNAAVARLAFCWRSVGRRAGRAADDAAAAAAAVEAWDAGMEEDVVVVLLLPVVVVVLVNVDTIGGSSGALLSNKRIKSE